MMIRDRWGSGTDVTGNGRDRIKRTCRLTTLAGLTPIASLGDKGTELDFGEGADRC
jgi:hypothetical protein